MTTEKTVLHPRNRHRSRYDFKQLVQDSPGLAEFILRTKYGDESIDFASAEAVKALNRAILKSFYEVHFWDIPKNYLCPPIPGRADYIHYIADLIGGKKTARVLDIGVGANCVYPLIGHYEYGWSFVGTDVDSVALNNAQLIINTNKLDSFIKLRWQQDKSIFIGVVDPQEQFDVTICNPPFHSSLEEAMSGTQRKWKNLGKGIKKGTLNFGGQQNELWTDGGELAFIQQMIQESVQVPQASIWFTTLVSKEENLPLITRTLQKMKVRQFKTIDMAQGQKKSRIVAWSFNS